MPLLAEMGDAVRRRRDDMGLSQQQLAELVSLSRATVSALETGKLKDLSSTRIERVANELGFAVGVVGTRRMHGRESGAHAAARVASVPYATQLPASVLLDSLRNGSVPPDYIPHLRTLLDEAPVALLAALAGELESVHGISQQQTWSRMRALAQVLQCTRKLWQRAST